MRLFVIPMTELSLFVTLYSLEFLLAFGSYEQYRSIDLMSEDLVKF